MKKGNKDECISIKVYITCPEKDKDCFFDKFNKFQELVWAEEGCLEFSLFKYPNSNTEYFLYEEYADKDAFNVHLNSDHVKEFFAFKDTLADVVLDAKIKNTLAFS